MPNQAPHVLVLFADQLTRQALSVAGNAQVATPHLDRLAARGVRFTQAYGTAPVCSPARTSILTGRMPHEVGVNTNEDALPADHPTLGAAFRAAGYATAYTGQWPLSPVTPPGDAHGFEFLPWANEPANPHLGADTDALTVAAAQSFLRREHARPFCLFVSLFYPHDICHYAPRDLCAPRTAAEGPPLPNNFARDPFEPEFISACRRRTYYGNEQNATRDWSLDHWRGYLHTYHRLVEKLDAEVGRLLATLEEQGLADDTLIAFLSDHGEGVGAHQWVVKLMLYEETAGVPLLLSWPGKIPAGVVDTTHLASGSDLLPTLCDYAGVTPPSTVSGLSLRPVIADPKLPGRTSLVSELQPEPDDPTRLGRMLRTARHKYIVFSHGRDHELLFDLSADPGEIRNLAHRPEHQSTLRQHRAILREWITQTADHFPLAACGEPPAATPFTR
jgi:arylsulfatase A-like enzyme